MTHPRTSATTLLVRAIGVLVLGGLLSLMSACGSPGSPEATDSTPTPAPTRTLSAPSPTPTPLGGANFVVYQTDRDGNWEIYLLDLASWQQYNLTQDPAEDRNPAVSPDGRRLAFESHRDGNWEIYLLDLQSGDLTRLTQDLAFDGAPTWSPDGSRIAFESYRDGNWEIYALTLEDLLLSRLTSDRAGDYAPAWSPDGRSIAFSSWRDGDKEIYVMETDGSHQRNLTNADGDDEYPAWSPDGERIAFVSSRDDGHTTEVYLMESDGQNQTRLTRNNVNDWAPAWSPDGQEIVCSSYNEGQPFEVYHKYRGGHYDLSIINVSDGQATALNLSTAQEGNPAMTFLPILLGDREPAPPPATATPVLVVDPEENEGLYELVQLPGLTGGDTRLNDRVDDSYNDWRAAVYDRTGYDYLALLSDATRRIDYFSKYSYFSWHKTGRTIDLRWELLDEDGGQRLEWMREDIGEELYWRLLIKCAAQDGTQGEPLKMHPWQYWWHIVPEEDPEAYAQGGRYMPVPDGYYEDFTALAYRYGWERIASYDEEDYTWHETDLGTEYWHYQRMDGLTWYEAMQEIYPPEMLERYFTWEIGKELGFSDEMLETKGIPRPEG
jgi:TolB protein